MSTPRFPLIARKAVRNVEDGLFDYIWEAVNKLRLVATTASVAVALTLPAGALAAADLSTQAQSPTRSQITPTAPSRLTTTTSSAAATTTAASQSSSDTTATEAGTLPNTGFDLLPETLAGVVLLGTGLALRVRHSRG